ncbi:MAG: hypothetical protein IRZ11_03730 [Clostridia bacterium]|nr:hypothetical protein [Clostridia bacterium]
MPGRGRGLILPLAASAALILASSEAFVNGVEWLAHRLRLGPAGTGAVLAALGGTLPETLVTLFAALSGQAGVSAGTSLGSPALLATFAFGLVAAASLLPERRARAKGRGAGRLLWDAASARRVAANLRWFVTLFACATVLAALAGWGARPAWARLSASLAFLCACVVFCLSTWDRGQPGSPPGRRLYLSPAGRPGVLPAALQTILATLGLALGAQGMAVHLERASAAWGLSPLAVSLWLAPFATELPEMATAALWASRGRLDLAMLNVSGALVMSATLPVAASLALAPWRLERNAALAAAVAFLGAGLTGYASRPRIRRRVLLALALVYVAYAAALRG